MSSDPPNLASIPSRRSLDVGGRPDLGRMSVGSQAPQLGRLSVTIRAPELGRQSAFANLTRNSVHKASNELARRRIATTQNAKLSVSIVERSTGAFVKYKSDGGRFKHSDTTLKLQQGGVYIITVVTTPPLEHSTGLMSIETERPGGGSALEVVELTATGDEDSGKQCSGAWTCNLLPSSRSSRYHMSMNFTLEEIGSVVVSINAKAYKPGDSHLQYGDFLNTVVYTVVRDGDDTAVRATQYISSKD